MFVPVELRRIMVLRRKLGSTNNSLNSDTLIIHQGLSIHEKLVQKYHATVPLKEDVSSRTRRGSLMKKPDSKNLMLLVLGGVGVGW